MEPTSACSNIGEEPLKPVVNASSQLHILDFLFPGFSGLSSLIHTYLGIDLNLYVPLLLLISCITFAWSYISDFTWGAVSNYLMSDVRIRTDDEIYNMIMAWVVTQPFAQQSRRSIVNTYIGSRCWFLWTDDEDESEDGESYEVNGPSASKKKLQYTPSIGSHYFWYNGRLLLFDRHENCEQPSFLSSSEREELTISCFGRNPQILRELLIDARTQYLSKDEGKTLMYRGAPGTSGGSPYWQRCMSRASRPISTVILDEKVKKDVIDDVTDYLNPETRRWYSNRGIPYRRGYLLYGPPGTGKSSLSLAMAGFFRLPIYMVNLNSSLANEEALATLFADLPLHCVVLLEDIDTAGLTHTRDEKDMGHTEEASVVSRTKTPSDGSAGAAVIQGRLSLSGLLNILDGVASQEGRVLVMTTNHLEKLDKALIRPGRVDMVVKFGLADAAMATSIFHAIYTPCEGERGGSIHTDSNSAALGPVQEQALTDKAGDSTTERIDALSKHFATQIPELEFSPAEIQGLLLKYKRDPEGVVTIADDWVQEMRKQKKLQKREQMDKM